MATSTTRLGLVKAEPTDSALIETAVSDNLDLVDANIGAPNYTSTTRPASPYDGQLIRETDTSALVVQQTGTPGVWKYVSIPVFASTADVDDPFTNLVVIQTSDNKLYRYTGSAWTEAIASAGTVGLYVVDFAGTQSTANNTDVFVDFSGTEISTTSHVTKTTSTGSVFTLNTSGVYAVHVQAVWASNTTGRRALNVVKSTDSAIRYCGSTASASGDAFAMPSASFERRFTAGDALKVMVNQNSGGALNLEALSWGDKPRISIRYLGT